jgi:hypothetical protein
MATRAGTLELIARELGEVLAPLEARLAGGGALVLLGELGVRLPDAVATHAQVVTAINGAIAKATALAPVVAQLAAAIAADNEAGIVSTGVQVVDAAAAVVDAFQDLSQALQTAASVLTPAERAALLPLINDIARRLFDFLVVEYLEQQSRPAAQALTLLGIVNRIDEPGDLANPSSVPFTRRELRLDRLGDLLSNPAGYLEIIYGFGTPGFDGLALFRRIKDFLDAFGHPVVLLEPPGGKPILEAYIVALETLATSPPSIGVKLRFQATEDFERTFDLPDPWSMRLGAKARFGTGMDATIAPPFDVELTPPGANASLELTTDIAAEQGGQPMLLLGEVGGTRLEATRIAAGFGFKAQADGIRLKGEPVVRAEVKGGKLVVDLSEGDGFIQTILKGVRVDSSFEVSARWTPGGGIKFEGGAGIELVVPLNRNLGPLEIQTLYILLGFAADPPITLTLAAALGVEIGPFAMSVDRIGVDVPVRFPPERNGNLGALDLGFGFHAPTGIGVVVDAGPISGGGFLAIDRPNGRYAGMLQLEASLVSVTAIALLDTKLPDGSPGFSFLILVSVELPSIQLGFGFTLTGVGGMAGIHRTVATEVLRQGIRAGALNHIMFPRDPVRNAPQIIADLRAIFPTAPNRFLFGPFLRIAWGTPSLVTGSLGVILELPDPVRILILGQLKVALPDPALPLVSLNLDALGIIDFGAQELSIDASLYDSRITIYSVYGDMALRLSWGARPVFALSIGGLHPHFAPPPNFPVLRRMTIEIAAGDNPRLSCQSYFAITANSVQLGARVEAYAAAAGFNIHGWLGFDAIIIFAPFSFRVDISGGVELRRGKSVIAGIHLTATLQGPNPWHAKGRACLSLFLFDICVPFSLTIGDEQAQPVPIVNAWDRLQAALRELRNWQSQLPPGTRRTLGYAVPPSSPLTQIDPVGGLAVQQKVLPLNKPLDKLGEARIDGDTRFDVSHVRVGAVDTPHIAQRDFFAAGQYQNLSDAEKLSRDSYELMDAGVSIAGDSVTAGAVRETPLVYETIVIDAPDPGTTSFSKFVKRSLGVAPLTEVEFARMADRAAGDLAPRVGLDRYAPTLVEGSRLTVGEDAFVIASTETLAVHGTLAKAMTKGDAHDALRAWVRDHPAERGAWQVVARYEAEAAA